MFSRSFFKTFMRLLRPHAFFKRNYNLALLSSTVAIYGFNQFNNEKSCQCMIWQSNQDFKKLIYSIEHKVVVIYNKETNKPVACGLVLDKEGLFLTISNVLQNQNPDEQQNLCAKLLSNPDFQLDFIVEYTMSEENLSFCRIQKSKSLDYIQFQTAKLNTKPEKGDSIILVSKNNMDMSVVETGIITDAKVKLDQCFNDKLDYQTYLLSTNITNNYSTIYGAPVFDEKGDAYGIQMPINPRLISDSSLTIPASFLEGIIGQYLKYQFVKRPYLGMSIKTAESSPGGGAFIIRISSEGPANQSGLKLGDVIKEVNNQKINTAEDLIKCIGYSVGQRFKITVDSDGKLREITFTTQSQP